MSPEDLAINRDEESGVRAALSRLPRHSATVLVLRHSGLSYAEVADATGVKVGQVGTMLRRAEAALRKLRAAGTTVFLNTHLLEEAEQVCDRVCVIDHGRSIATGTLAELVGRASSVRMKIGGLGQGWWRYFSDFGHRSADSEWLTVEHIASSGSPSSLTPSLPSRVGSRP